MKLYAYRASTGEWYQGLFPNGSVRLTPKVEEAFFFTLSNIMDAENCADMGMSCYEMEMSEPVLVKKGTSRSA